MESIVATVRAEAATELERLGSDRGLIALTDADLTAGTIRTRFASVVAGAAGVYGDWGEETGVFADVATSTHEVAETVSPEDDPSATDHPVVAYLRTVEDEPGRIGAGLVGLPLVLDGWALQGVSFFVNEADEAAADQFRTARAEFEPLRETAEERLADRPGESRESATEAALELISVTYDDYVETLEEMGLDPKTVC